MRNLLKLSFFALATATALPQFGAVWGQKIKQKEVKDFDGLRINLPSPVQFPYDNKALYLGVSLRFPEICNGGPGVTELRLKKADRGPERKDIKHVLYAPAFNVPGNPNPVLYSRKSLKGLMEKVEYVVPVGDLNARYSRLAVYFNDAETFSDERDVRVWDGTVDSEYLEEVKMRPVVVCRPSMATDNRKDVLLFKHPEVAIQDKSGNDTALGGGPIELFFIKSNVLEVKKWKKNL